MNKKGQEGWIIFISFLGGAIVMFLLISGGIITGVITLDSCKCGFITREAKGTIIGDSSFDGKGVTDANFEVKLRNDEEQAAKFKINLICKTAKDYERISSDYLYVQPQTIENFQIKYKVGFLEDWKCDVSSTKGETIASCESIS